MLIIGAVLVILLLCLVAVLQRKRKRQQRELQQHRITPEELRSLLDSKRDILIFDVRQPLDLLAYPEIIPGAQRVTPQEVLNQPTVIPKDREVVVYCTCAGEKTSRAILRRALDLHFSRIKFLSGGLAGWKAKGFPVEPYREPFQLAVPIASPPHG
jgi:rhodanese-related sulfurtransferase